jgi:hypothetical protein
LSTNNQFLDPPIDPYSRSDDPEQTSLDFDETTGEDEIREEYPDVKQNVGYKSICRE